MRGRPSRPLVTGVLAVLVLVGVVTVASTGTTPSGSGETRPPADIFMDTVFTLTLLALIPGAAILIYGLMQRKEIADEIASGRVRRSNLAAGVLFAVCLAAAVYYGFDERLQLPGGNVEAAPIGGPEGLSPGVDTSEARMYHAEVAWIPVLVVVGLVAVATLAIFVASRRRRDALRGEETSVADQLADVLEDTLDDLRAEPDARRAVIAAYARLERALAAAGRPRRQHETAAEYVPRLLAGLEVDERAVRSLTDLFTRAKFSDHPVDESMKLEAIASLERIRDDLRRAAARAEELARVPEEREPAATS